MDQKKIKGKQICAGWRHYKMIFGGRSACVISTPEGIAKSAARYQAKVFKRGTWEIAGTEQANKSFALPLPEVQAEIYNV